MGGSSSKPALCLRGKNETKNLEAFFIKGKEVRVFDTSDKSSAGLVSLGLIGKKEEKDEAGSSAMNGTAFNNDGTLYACFDLSSDTINIIDTQTGSLVKKLGKDIKLQMCDQVVFSPDSKFVYFASKGLGDVTQGFKEVLAFDIETGELLSKNQNAHDKAISCMTVSRCGKFIATGDIENKIVVGDLSNPDIPQSRWYGQGQPIITQATFKSPVVTSVAFSGDSKFLYATVVDTADAAAQPKCFGYDMSMIATSSSQVCGLGMLDDEKIYKVATSGCGKMIVGVTENSFLRVFTIEKDGSLTKKFDIEGFSGPIESIGCSIADNKVAVCCRDNSLWLADLNTGKKLVTKPLDAGISQYAPVFSPNGQLLAAPNSGSGSLTFYAVFNGNPKAEALAVKNGEKIMAGGPPTYGNIKVTVEEDKVTISGGGEKGDEVVTVAF